VSDELRNGFDEAAVHTSQAMSNMRQGRHHGDDDGDDTHAHAHDETGGDKVSFAMFSQTIFLKHLSFSYVYGFEFEFEFLV
jgi:hypothetical protein